MMILYEVQDIVLQHGNFDTFAAYLLRDEVAFLLWRLRLPKRFKRRMGPDAVCDMWRNRSDAHRKAAIRQTAKKFNFGREPHRRSTKESA